MKKIVGYIAGINFLCFMGGVVYLGGDALNGRVENGRFFLANRGKLIEVSEEIFNYSIYHGLSVFILIGLTLIIHFADKSKENSMSRD